MSYNTEELETGTSDENIRDSMCESFECPGKSCDECPFYKYNWDEAKYDPEVQELMVEVIDSRIDFIAKVWK